MQTRLFVLAFATLVLQACAVLSSDVHEALSVQDVNIQREALHGKRIVVEAYVSHEGPAGVFVMSDGDMQDDGWMRCSLPVDGYQLWFQNRGKLHTLRDVDNTRVRLEGTFSNTIQPAPGRVFIDYVPKGSPAVASLGPLESVRVLKIFTDDQCR